LQLEQQASAYDGGVDAVDKFRSVVMAFLERARTELAVLESMHEKMKSECSKVHKYYALDAKYTMDEFLHDMAEFARMYQARYTFSALL
jgi:hypothetical protein